MKRWKRVGRVPRLAEWAEGEIAWQVQAQGDRSSIVSWGMILEVDEYE